MKTPKLLPWLARSAGLSDARTEELWLESCRYAQNLTDEVDTPRYWKVSHERLIDLVDADSTRRCPAEAMPFVMIQNHLSMALLVITDLVASVSATARVHLSRWFNSGTHRTV